MRASNESMQAALPQFIEWHATGVIRVTKHNVQPAAMPLHDKENPTKHSLLQASAQYK